jgi:hypothetical protein
MNEGDKYILLPMSRKEGYFAVPLFSPAEGEKALVLSIGKGRYVAVRLRNPVEDDTVPLLPIGKNRYVAAGYGIGCPLVLTNGGFELGDVTGWTVVDTYGSGITFGVNVAYANGSSYGGRFNENGKTGNQTMHIYQSLGPCGTGNIISFDFDMRVAQWGMSGGSSAPTNAEVVLYKNSIAPENRLAYKELGATYPDTDWHDLFNSVELTEDATDIIVDVVFVLTGAYTTAGMIDFDNLVITTWT